MKRIATPPVLAFLFLGSLLTLGGCSRQSVADFTPYPAEQGVIRFSLHPLPASFTTPDGWSVSLDRVEAAVAAIGPTDATVGAAAALRAHTDEHDTGGQAADGAESVGGNDPNVAAGDSRPLVPLALPVGRFIDLLTENEFGGLSVRGGASTTWTVSCAPASHAAGLVSLVIRGHIASGAASSPVWVTIADPFALSVPMDRAAVAGSVQTLTFTLHPVHWFEGLPIAAALGSGPIVIDAANAAWRVRFLQNFKASVGHPDHDHVHDDDHPHEHEPDDASLRSVR